MKLNKTEFIAMNNPVRRWFQKHIELSIFDSFLKQHQINLNGSEILDVGCGSGYSTRLLKSKYNPKEIIAFDFMSEQIELARQRDPNTNYFVGDVANINLSSNKFDAVFVFGVLHHVPEWKKGLQEIYRVIKPKGIFLVEEGSKKIVDFADKYLRWQHPPESRFDWPEFIKELKVIGFDVIGDSKIVINDFRSFICAKPAANNSSQ